MKEKSLYKCSECEATTPRWMGQCPGCGSWNTLQEESFTKSAHKWVASSSEVVRLADIKDDDSSIRLKTKIDELDRVLGGGIVTGSMILIGGDPGIGKSTLVLQALNHIASKKKAIYVCGEESPSQVNLRARRLGVTSDNLLLHSETNIEKIISTASELKPDILVIDSIQTIYSPESDSTSGSASQVRNCSCRLLQFAKQSATPVIVVGHVTKDGSIAGPKILEHMVDTVLYFEGDASLSYRILRATKNRFGSTNEIGIFEMAQEGLKQIKNPSGFFLEERPDTAPGSVVISCMEGTRPILVELQALVTPTKFGLPKRGSVGVDLNRLSIILAVMERRVGMQLQGCDIFVNVVGGIKVSEPAVDLGMIMAIGSGYKNRPIKNDIVAFGEVGLGGEVRAITLVEQRVKEAARMCFKKCILPHKSALKFKKHPKEMEIIGVKHIGEALGYV